MYKFTPNELKILADEIDLLLGNTGGYPNLRRLQNNLRIKIKANREMKRELKKMPTKPKKYRGRVVK